MSVRLFIAWSVLMLTCQQPPASREQKPFVVAMTYVADCPLSVRSSSAWLSLLSDLSRDSFERWLLVGDCQTPAPTALIESADRVIRSMDTARMLGFTHYPMVQIWKNQASPENLLYSGPLDDIAIQTGRVKMRASENYAREFLNRIRNQQNPTFEKRPVFGCYIEP